MQYPYPWTHSLLHGTRCMPLHAHTALGPRLSPGSVLGRLWKCWRASTQKQPSANGGWTLEERGPNVVAPPVEQLRGVLYAFAWSLWGAGCLSSMVICLIIHSLLTFFPSPPQFPTSLQCFLRSLPKQFPLNSCPKTTSRRTTKGFHGPRRSKDMDKGG